MTGPAEAVPGAIAVVGAGQAGVQLATSLRELGYVGRLVLVGAEQALPYQRPPLSKGFLAGTVPLGELELRDPSFLSRQGIELLLGRTVEAVDLDAGAGVLRLDDGTRVRFDALALATGARPRPLPLANGDAAGVMTLRDLADAQQLQASLADAHDVVVIGGGFIGLEVAATARAQGKRVTVLEAAGRLLARVVADPISRHVLAVHEAAGTTVITSATVTALTVGERVSGVVLADGRVIPADLVVAGIGAEPIVELARNLGLVVEGGIVTDSFGRTGHPQIVAVGDCTVQPHPHEPDRLLALESVNNAVEQATAAARVLLGLDPAPRGVPWFWSNQGELKLQMAGISDGHDDYVVRGDGADGRLTVLYYRQGRLIAGDVVGNPRDFNAVKSALARGGTIDPAKAASLGVPLKDLVSGATGPGRA